MSKTPEEVQADREYWRVRNRNNLIIGVVVALLTGFVLLFLEECTDVDLGERRSQSAPADSSE